MDDDDRLRSPYPELRPVHRADTEAAHARMLAGSFGHARMMDAGDGWERIEMPVDGHPCVLMIQAPDPDESPDDRRWTIGMAEAEFFPDGTWEAETSNALFTYVEAGHDDIPALLSGFLAHPATAVWLRSRDG